MGAKPTGLTLGLLPSSLFVVDLILIPNPFFTPARKRSTFEMRCYNLTCNLINQQKHAVWCLSNTKFLQTNTHILDTQYVMTTVRSSTCPTFPIIAFVNNSDIQREIIFERTNALCNCATSETANSVRESMCSAPTQKNVKASCFLDLKKR